MGKLFCRAKQPHCKSLGGFTLAEVLITLGIIGIVAAMTMPSLIASHREKETVVKVKRMYSILGQAYQSIIFDEGTPDNWKLVATTEAGATELTNKFKSKLNIMKDCGFKEGCFPSVTYKIYGGSNSINFITGAGGGKRYMVLLNDGSSIAFYAESGLPKDDNAYGVIYYDTNGYKSPNQFGKDLFQFALLKDRIMPSYYDAGRVLPQCLFEGTSCAAWIIANDNVDYWKCPSKLNWQTKTSCK